MITNPKIKYTDRFKINEDGTRQALYDEDYCILEKIINNDKIRIVSKAYHYGLLINEEYNVIYDNELGKVIHDIMRYDDADIIVNRLNRYCTNWVTEPLMHEDGQIRTINPAWLNTIMYENAKEFINEIKEDIRKFNDCYPEHELRNITVHDYNQKYYRLSFFMDDHIMEEFLDYCFRKEDAEIIIRELKNQFNVSIYNETEDVLIREL